MSTRAIVAQPYGDTWRGRHTHSDGYPSGRGRNLWALVKRDGVEKVRQVITEDYCGWSSINPDEHGPLHAMHSDGRFVIVPGYGVAYTIHNVSPDDWRDPTDTVDAEWAYVLADDALWVLKCNWGDPPTLVGTYRWDSAEPDWDAVEKAAYGE